MNKITTKFQYILSLLLSLYTVIFLWWFFGWGIYSLWLNASIFWFWFFILFLLTIENKIEFVKKNIFWIFPYLIIILSYAIYEIPFLKSVNLWLLPLMTLFFFGYSKIWIINHQEWSFFMIKKIIFRKIHIKKNINIITENINSWDDKKNILYKKIITWIGVFMFINIFIISLLMWADSNFKKLIWNIWELINLVNIIKIAIAGLLTLIFISLSKLWEKENIIESIQQNKTIDSIIWWIILWGTLFTYILFIFVQLDTLFHSNWLDSVQNIANLAKTWFWQLFFISIINIIFFFIYYKKTNNFVQKLLGIFIFASVIILLSAVHKMFLYTHLYGLSYEKFFASFTILYFGILFLIMIWFIVLNKKNDILKTSCILALWMYSSIHILPTEAFIFKINTNILQSQDTKIQKYQSHMLSVDILHEVNQIRWKKIFIDENWQEWSDKKIKNSLKKPWYEKNIQDIKISLQK